SCRSAVVVEQIPGQGTKGCGRAAAECAIDALTEIAQCTQVMLQRLDRCTVAGALRERGAEALIRTWCHVASPANRHILAQITFTKCEKHHSCAYIPRPHRRNRGLSPPGRRPLLSG